ncbi:RNA ligase family protein [Nonomuraea sp. NPDC049421]|uniref:RNA ligase family protein n=1 Tax=Nonomuraea sp. NPDC049421 TaxID=3155275 RepID=UPI0034422B94
MSPEDLRHLAFARKLGSATKYPSIPTYHQEGPRGMLLEELLTPFPEGSVVRLEEKLNGWNCRVVLGRGWWAIGSRKDWVAVSAEDSYSSEGGLVEALKPAVKRIDYDALLAEVCEDVPSSWDPIVTLYVEVYGREGSVKGWQSYGDGSKAGVRLFDVALTDPLILGWDIERIASWRQNGGQVFMPSPVVDCVAKVTKIRRVPLLATIDTRKLPTTVDDMAFMLRYYGTTLARVTSGGSLVAEGVIMRTLTRSIIAKAHLARYERTQRLRAEDKRLAAKKAARA